MPPKKRKESSEGCENEEGAPAPKFDLNKPLLGFHRRQLYAGKAVKRRRRGDGWQYLVHYHGWGSKYDEWLSEDLLYPGDLRRVRKAVWLLPR
jgi:hypothetical protein